MILFKKQLEPKKGKLNGKISLYAFLFLLGTENAYVCSSNIVIFMVCYTKHMYRVDKSKLVLIISYYVIYQYKILKCIFAVNFLDVTHMLLESGFNIIKQLFISFLGFLTILVYHFYLASYAALKSLATFIKY